MTSFKAVALIAALSVAGLSSALAVCVAACTGEVHVASMAAAPACHEQSEKPGPSIESRDTGCPHLPAASVGVVELVRGERSHVVFAVAVVHLWLVAERQLVESSRSHIVPPSRPVSSPPVLRV